MASLEGDDGYLAKLQQIQDADAARLDAFRQADQDRRALLEDIITKYKQLKEKHGSLKSDNRALKADIKDLGAELETIKYEQDSSSLVGVFIDGDGSKFHEKLIKEGAEGGAIAAHNIKVAIKNQLKECHPGINTENWRIMVWYIAAMDGLASVYQGYLSQNTEYSGVNFKDALRRFAIGFNRGADYNFNFIDVGGGRDLKLKEVTDTKLRETFKMMLPHCRHVFFAGCHDEGYVTFLSPYKHDQRISSKITLIETHGTRPKYHDLGFKMTKFPDIFREEDFSSSKTLHQPTNPSFASESPNLAGDVASPFPATKNPAPSPVISPTGTTPSVKSARNGLPPPSRTIYITPAKRTSDGVAKKYYLVNAKNQRLDEALPKKTQQMQDQYSARIQNENGGRNICNQCYFSGPETCNQQADFRHGRVSLTPDEDLVLKQMVRGIQCSKGSWCDDVSCPYGHHCKYGDWCKMGESCKFASTHHLDMTPIRQVFADGSSKLV